MFTVYLIRAVGVQKIKVGVTSNLARRLCELRAVSPVSLEVIRTVDGVGFNVEKTIHHLMREYHSHGEWYDEAAISIALRWMQITETSASKVVEIVSQHLPAGCMQRVIALFDAAGAANIANELTNISGQSIMDRKWA